MGSSFSFRAPLAIFSSMARTFTDSPGVGRCRRAEERDRMPPVRRSPMHSHLSRILVERRIAADLSQAELAERIDRPQSFVSKFERGERRLDVVELLEVAAGLGCDVEGIVSDLKRACAPKRARSA